MTLQQQCRALIAKFRRRVPSNEVPRCPECTAYLWPEAKAPHFLTCSKQTHEQLRMHLDYYHTAWLSQQQQARAQWDRYRKEMEHWQGKWQAVKHENNQLRNKLYRREHPKKP